MATDQQEQERIPLADAYRAWTGRDLPPRLEGAERAAFEAKLAQAEQDARRIYGDAEAA